MKKYSIGEVSVLLNLKPYVIRYWEKEFPFLKPKRSLTGRRVYTEREIQRLFRLKYLLHERRITLAGAKQKIWEETVAPEIDMKLSIQEIRGDLLEILDHFHDQKTSFVK